ncbi:MAG: hypothetical protein ACRDN0_34555, partial [Trebonia sp.]
MNMMKAGKCHRFLVLNAWGMNRQLQDGSAASPEEGMASDAELIGRRWRIRLMRLEFSLSLFGMSSFRRQAGVAAVATATVTAATVMLALAPA